MAEAHAHHHHHHHHGHEHDPGRQLAIGIGLNLAFVVIEWGFGVHAQSLALMADATHNLGDVLGLVLAWGAARLGLRASSILAALANALLLVAVTGGLVWEAVLRLQEPRTVEGGIVIGVALAGIVVNGLTAWL